MGHDEVHASEVLRSLFQSGLSRQKFIELEARLSKDQFWLLIKWLSG